MVAAGIDTFMYTGDTPWRSSGTYVGDEPISSRQAIVKAGLDWTVSLRPIFTKSEDGIYDRVETHKAVMRDTDESVLGIVGKRYTPIQNYEAFEFMDSLVGEELMQYHTAGSFRGGQRIWLLGQIGSEYILPNDRIDQFMFLHNAHDGSSSLRCMFVNLRAASVAVYRTTRWHKRGDAVVLRHTTSIASKVQQARRVLGLAQDEFEDCTAFQKALAKLELPFRKFNAFLENLIPDNDDEDASNARAEKARDSIRYIYQQGEGSDIPGVKGSGWGAYCAVIGYVNYHRTQKGSDSAQEQRFETSLNGTGNDLIQRATHLLNAYLEEAHG
jgi:phage/plasmid-like protein (TIGR03299 family)